MTMPRDARRAAIDRAAEIVQGGRCGFVARMPERLELALVRCDVCGHEWADVEAAFEMETAPCPKGCDANGKPARVWSEVERKYVHRPLDNA